jgi:hypothetical protein
VPGRALGSTTLALILVIAAALLVARAVWPPRTVVVAATTFVLSVVYQLLLLAILGVTADVEFAGLGATELALIAVMNAAIAIVAVAVIRAIDLRFGEPERLAW